MGRVLVPLGWEPRGVCYNAFQHLLSSATSGGLSEERAAEEWQTDASSGVFEVCMLRSMDPVMIDFSGLFDKGGVEESGGRCGLGTGSLVNLHVRNLPFLILQGGERSFT